LRDTGKSWFKFVITDNDEADFQELDSVVADAGLPVQRVMVMPEGSVPRTNIARAQRIVDRALERGFGLSLRTHVLLWNDDPDR
jgi:organic radical activating enzyme